MKQYFAFLLLVVCALFRFPNVLHAQGEGAIHGVVMAAADGSAIPNATVRLEGPSLPKPLQTTSMGDGHFGFQRLAPGDYFLTAARQEFLEGRVDFTLKPREVQNITLDLALRPVRETVEVEAEAETLVGAHTPSSTVLQAQNIESLPLTGKSNLPDMLATVVPGMIRSHDDFIHVRGSEIALNTFINGVSFWENPHSVFSAGLNPDLIQSMNVLTGGFPAEYGNRFGGVLDVVTKSGFSMNNAGALTLGAGTALRHNAGIEYGGHTERAAFFVSSSAFESGRYLSPPDPRAIHDTGRGVRNFLQLDFNLNPANYLKLVLMGDGTNFEIPKTEFDEEFRPNANAFQRTRAQTAILTWGHVFSNDALLSTSLYQRWSRSRLLPAEDPFATRARSERTLNTVGIKSDLTRFFGRHTVKGGTDLVLLRPDEELSYDNAGYRSLTHQLGLPHPLLEEPIEFSEKKTGGQISFYVQDKIQWTDALTVDLGLRYDRYTLGVSDFHFSPRLNLAYRLRTGTVLYGSYNHFFVPPAIENVLAGSAGLTRFVEEIGEPLPALRPMVEDQFELGVTHPFHRHFRLGVSGYYRLSNNPVHSILFEDSRIYTYSNFDRGDAYGLEIKMEMPTLERLGLSGFLNYALGRVYLYNPVVGGFTTEAEGIEESGRFLAPMDQTHTLSAGFTYRHRRTGLWTSMTFEYGSGTPVEHHGPGEAEHGGEEEGAAAGAAMEMPPLLRVPEHFTQNLSVGVDLLRNGERPRLGLQFNIENLSNNLYRKTAESIFSPGEFSIPRLYSGSVKFYF